MVDRITRNRRISMELSITQAVAEVLRNAGQALTLTEVLAQVRLLRPGDMAKPEAAVRNAFSNLRASGGSSNQGV